MNIKSFILILIVFICPRLFAADISSDEMVHLVLQKASSAVMKVEKNKIYLNSTKVRLLNDRIALQDDSNGFIPISVIRSNEHGLYVKPNDFNFPDIFGMWKCHVQGCGYWNSSNVNVCQNCHTLRGGFPE